MTTDTFIFEVKETIKEARNVRTLRLAPTHGTAPDFIPGQFITVYFPELGTPEGKAYSISGAPGGGTVDITVKRIGEFSDRLCDMIPGDKVSATPPYGYFYTESADTPLVCAAAGIGIAPFHSMILAETKRRPERPMELLVSQQAVADAAFGEEFTRIAAECSQLHVTRFVTRERPLPRHAIGRRMKADDLLEASLGAMRRGGKADPEFFLCGSIEFVRDLWRGLRAGGVPEERIYTEAFFSANPSA